MARDPAMVWEAEMLMSRRAGASAGWVSIRRAAEITGVPAPTVRNWAKGSRIGTRLEVREGSHIRLVKIADVERRAEALGRAPFLAADEPEGVESDMDRRQEPSVPDGAILVPRDAWDRMLDQLGNLHQAGQQLAEARERAAKAETEARFLRERVAELRTRLSQKPEDKVEEQVPQPPTPPVEQAPQAPPPLWWEIYRRVRRRR